MKVVAFVIGVAAAVATGQAQTLAQRDMIAQDKKELAEYAKRVNQA